MRYQESKGDNSPEDLSNWPDKVQQSTESLTSEECTSAGEATSDQAFCRWLHQIWTISNNVTSRLKYLLRASPSSRTSSSDRSLETNGDESSSDELTTLNDAGEAGDEFVRHRDSCAYAHHSPCAHGIPHGHLCVPGLPCAREGHEEHRVIKENDLRPSEIKLPGIVLRNSVPHPVLVLPRIRHENNGPRMYTPEVFQRGVRTGCRYHRETRNYQVYWNDYARTRQRRMDDLVGYEIPERLSPTTSLKPKSKVNADGNDCQKMTNFSNHSTKLDFDALDASKNFISTIRQTRILEGSVIQGNKNMEDSLMDVKSQKNCWESRLSDIPSQDPSSNDSKEGLSLGLSLRSTAEENASVENKICESQDERRDEPEKNLEMSMDGEENGNSLKVNVINSETKSKTQNQMAAANELCQERKFSLTTESCFDTLLTSLRAKMNTLNADTHLNGVRMSTSVRAEKVKRSLSSMKDPNMDNINCTLEKYSRATKECKANCEATRPSFSERIQDIWQDSSTVPWSSFYKEEPLKLISNERKEPAKMSIFGLKKQSSLAECFGEYGAAVKLANILEAMTESKAGKSALLQEQQILKISEEPQRLLTDESKSKISHIGIQYSSSALAIENEISCRTENSKGYETFNNKLADVSIETPRSLQIFMEHSILPVSTVEIKPLTHQIRGFAQYHHVFPHTLTKMNSTFSSDSGDLPKQHLITVKGPLMQDATDVPVLDYKLKKYEWLPLNIKVSPAVNCQMLVQESISTRIRSWLLKKFHRKRSNANLCVGQRFKRIKPSVMNKKISNLLKHIKRKGKLRNELEETQIFEKFPKKMPIPPTRRRRKRYNALNKQNVDAVLKNVLHSNSIENIKFVNEECSNMNSASTKSINDESNSVKNIKEETHVDSNLINVTSSTLSIKEPIMISSSQKNVMDQLKFIVKTDISNNQNKDGTPIQLNAEDSLLLPEKNCVNPATEVTGKMPLTDATGDTRTSKLEMGQDVNKINSSSSITYSSTRIAESDEIIKIPLNNPAIDTSTNCATSGLDNKSASVDKKEFYRKKYQFLSKQIIKKKELGLKQPEVEHAEKDMLLAKKEKNIKSVIQDEINHKSDKEQSLIKYKKHQNSYKRTNNKKSKCVSQSLSPISELEPLNEKIDLSLNSNTRMHKDKVIYLKKSDKSEVVTKVELISCGNELKDRPPEMNKNLIPIKEYKMEDQGTQSSTIFYNNDKRNLQAKRSSYTVEARIPITSIKSQDKDLSYGSIKAANNSVQPCLENRTESKRTTITDPYSISQEVSKNNQTKKALASNGSRSPVASSNITKRVERRNPNENKLMYLSRIKKKMEESRNAKLSITKEIKAESDVVLQMSNDDCTTIEKRNKSIGYALVEEGLRVPENSGFLDPTEGDSKILKTRSEYKATEILERLIQITEKVESTMVKKSSNYEKIESTKSKQNSELRHARSVLYSSGNLKRIPLDNVARKTILNSCLNTNSQHAGQSYLSNDNIRSVK